MNSKSLEPRGLSQYNRPTDFLTPVSDLSYLFPDISGELCSRHSTLMGKLKTTFNKLYDGFEPTHYVIVKGSTQIIGNSDEGVQLSMGMQNGIIVLVRKTYENANIYVNGNHIDEQLILNCKGKVQQGLYEISQEIERISSLALTQCIQEQLFGGILYVHANIPEGFYDYKNSLLTALFLSFLVINNKLENYPIPEMIGRLTESQLIDPIFLQKQFYDYENRAFSLMVGSNVYKVPLDSSIKLMFCRLDLAHRDIKYSQTSIKQKKEDKEKALDILRSQFGISSFYEAFENHFQINPNSLISSTNNQENILFAKLIDAELKQLQILCEYSNKRISIQQLFRAKWEIDSKIRKIYSQQVIQLAESIQTKTGIQAYTIVQQSYLLLAVEKSKYTELICILRQLLHRGGLKSKSCFKLEEQLVENRWGNENSDVGEKIFVSVPSKGIGIFDPSNSIWFE